MMAALPTMKRRALFPAACAFALILVLNACGKQEQPAAAKPAPAEPVAEKPAAPTPAPAPVKPAEPVFAEAPVDLNGFGSEEPAIRADEPTRGVIVIEPKDIKQMSAQHWEQFDCTNLTAKRWGRYEVRVTYTLKHATIGTQFRFGGQPMKKTLVASSQPKRVVYGQVYIEKPGTYPFTLYVAATGAESGLSIQQVSFVPAPEGPISVQNDDGSIVLEAKSATTWSESMRHEPKPEKNCLGFWTNEDDFAEWDFEVSKPGRFKVTVVYGCGTGSGGSDVEVKFGDKNLKFTVKDTGGFQNWTTADVGEIEITKAGTERLVIDPVNKLKGAVLDVQKVLLTPAG